MGHQELQPEDIDVTISALRAAFKRTWCAFCDATSIHGLKYTRDQETNRCIRIIWILITLLMFICAMAMITTFYMEYRSNPTRMNVDNDNTPISSLLFPSTLICPEELYNLHKSVNFLKTLIMPNSTSPSEVQELLYYVYAFIYDDVHFDEKDAYLLEEVLTLNKLNILEFLNELSWECADILFRCRFKNKIVPCEEMFDDFYTFRGHCCACNLNQTFNNIDNIHAAAGLRNGLSLILYYNDSLYVERNAYSRGFKVFIKEIGTFASSHSPPKFVPLDEEVFISVRPTQTFCSQSVKDLPFENRLCVFPQEKKLKYFDSYLGSNCEINCRIERMLQLCHCYAFVFYNKRINERICSFKDLPCLMKHHASIIGRFKKTQCTCYRNCEKINYNSRASGAPLRLNAPTVDSFYDDIKKAHSIVHINLNSQVYRRVRHHLLTNMVTLVSNLGSAFSLFVGMSMISAVEIIYYFSIILNKFYRQECRARILLKQLQENKIRQDKDIQHNLKVENIN